MREKNKNPKKSYTPQFKAEVALDALSQMYTVDAVAKKHGVNKTQVNSWRNQLKENAPSLFMKGKVDSFDDKQGTIDDLQQLVGQQAMEIATLKKKLR